VQAFSFCTMRLRSQQNNQTVTETFSVRSQSVSLRRFFSRRARTTTSMSVPRLVSSVEVTLRAATRGAIQPFEPVTQKGEPSQRAVWFGGGSLLVACIEALCALLLAISKLGVLLALASFLSSVIISRFHADRVRVPVLGLAFLAALINLFVLWNWRQLRNAKAAAWRKRRLTARQRWQIASVLITSTATITLVVGEFWIHPVHLF
jgi:hypothetical protein